MKTLPFAEEELLGLKKRDDSFADHLAGEAIGFGGCFTTGVDAFKIGVNQFVFGHSAFADELDEFGDGGGSWHRPVGFPLVVSDPWPLLAGTVAAVWAHQACLAGQP
jgi:hypothetical protein